MQLVHAQEDARFWASLLSAFTDDLEGHKGLLATTQRAIAEREPAAADTAAKAQAAKDRLARVEKGEAVAGVPAPMTRKDLLKISGMTEAQLQHCERVAKIADRGWFRLMADEQKRRKEKVDKAVERELYRLHRQTSP